MITTAACDCLNDLDMCDMATGQCSSCPQLVVGRTCDSCADNSFGDPNTGCEVSTMAQYVDLSVVIRSSR